MASDYRFIVRDQSGNLVARLDQNDWVYFEYTKKVNDVGTAQGIMSPKRQATINILWRVEGDSSLLDNVMEVWRRPYARNEPTGWLLDAQLLIRYERREQLNDGRPRITVIMREITHLLKRSIVWPRTVIPPAVDGPDDVIDPGPDQWPWLLPIEDDFTGSGATWTSTNMYQLVSRCMTTNPAPFTEIQLPGVLNTGGIEQHLITERHTNLLDALQRMSAASWYRWWVDSNYGDEVLNPSLGPPGIAYPVDFSLVMAGPAPYWPWTFTAHVGGLGDDLRVGYATAGAHVLLTPENNSLNMPVLIHDRSDEVTRVAVGGADSDRGRDILLIKNDEAEQEGDWNVSEQYIDSRRIEAFSPRFGLYSCEPAGPAKTFNYRIDKEAATDVGVGDVVRVRFESNQHYGDVQVVNYTVSGFESDDIELFFPSGPAGMSCEDFGGAVKLIVLDTINESGVREAARQGEQRLRDEGFRRDFTMNVSQNPTHSYGRHYFLGDAISVAMDGEIFHRQVVEARIVLARDRIETVEVTLAALDGSRFNGFTAFEQMRNTMLDQGIELRRYQTTV